MIDQLLRLVAEGGVHSYEDLTRHLSISQPLLEMMLEDLGRLGARWETGAAGTAAAAPSAVVPSPDRAASGP